MMALKWDLKFLFFPHQESEFWHGIFWTEKWNFYPLYQNKCVWTNIKCQVHKAIISHILTSIYFRLQIQMQNQPLYESISKASTLWDYDFLILNNHRTELFYVEWRRNSSEMLTLRECKHQSRLFQRCLLRCSWLNPRRTTPEILYLCISNEDGKISAQFQKKMSYIRESWTIFLLCDWNDSVARGCDCVTLLWQHQHTVFDWNVPRSPRMTSTCCFLCHR